MMNRARTILLILATFHLAAPAAAETYVVTQRGGGANSRLVSELESLGAAVTALPQIGVLIAESDDASFAAAAVGLRGVLNVAPDAVFSLGDGAVEGLLPNAGDDDDLHQLQWGHTAIQLTEAWDVLQAEGSGRGADVRVAVLDTGIDADHPDLVPNLNFGLGRSFIPGEPWQARPGFIFHHGTSVAGVIAAADNGLGIVGVAPDAELVAVKVVSEYTNTGSAAALLQGIVYAADIDADVINMSLGAGLSLRDGEPAARLWTAFVRAAVYAHQQGATLVASAGNDMLDLDGDRDARVIPAQLPHVLTVTSTAPAAWALDPQTDLDLVSSYNNFGRTVVDFAAPGGGFHDYPGAFAQCTVGPMTSFCISFDFVFTTIGDGWLWANGTSFAAPHVAGVAALVIGQAGGSLHPAQVAAKLRLGADDLGEPGKDPYFGHGRINALGAVQ